MSARPITLVISPVEWGFIWQRHQTMASLFARDSDVVFCEVLGIRRVRPGDLGRVLRRLRIFASGGKSGAGTPPPAGVRVARPLLLPATNRVFCAANERFLDRFLRCEPMIAAGVDLILNYSPSRSALQLIARVPCRRLVYDCTDHWPAVHGIPAFLPEDERTLLAKADLTLVPSRRLRELKESGARRIALVPHGALVERFLLEPRPRPEGGAVTVLYYGHLHQQHLDFDLLDRLARSRPAWRVMLVGPVRTPHAFPSNVTLAGMQPHERLRDFIREADALLMPYRINDYTRAVLPAKIYECLATGRPIVAVPLPELKQGFAEYVQFATDGPGFAQAVELALAADTAERRAKRIALARVNTWEDRYRQVRELLAALDAPEAPKP
jgi:glycosyltransferase involved in cell wall biosynthesis